MKNSKKVVRAAIVTALLAILLAVGVFLFPWKLKPYDEVGLLKPKVSSWQGVLKVWQLNDWRVGSYSRTGLLQAAARRYENKHIGVYVEIENVTVELFQKRLAAGEKPDVLSFPDGWAGIGSDLLLDLGSAGLPPLEDPFRRAFAEESRAVPWMAGGELVLTNNAVGRAVGVEPPQADSTWSAKALVDYSAAAATGRRKKPVTAMSGAASLYESLALEGVSLKALSTKSLLSDNPFTMNIDKARGVYTTGKCAVLLCTQWEASLMARLAAKNKAFEYTVLPWPAGLRPCLSVQFASALSSGDDNKDAAETAFIAVLLSQNVQKDIANKACSLPVVALPDDALPQGELEKMLFAELPISHMPRPFALRDDAAVAAALGGDSAAAEKVKKRFVN
jgi:ABC-type glycerol-3-phosphate transport system substrate-binding protein